jgi:hypothetical protein
MVTLRQSRHKTAVMFADVVEGEQWRFAEMPELLSWTYFYMFVTFNAAVILAACVYLGRQTVTIFKAADDIVTMYISGGQLSSR